MKITKIFSVMLAAITCISIAGCRPVGVLNNCPVLTASEFESRLADLGYTGVVSTELDNCTQHVYKADGVQASLSIYPTKTAAAKDFQEATASLEELMAAHTSMTVGSRARWSGSTGDEKVLAYLIDDTIIAINSSSDKAEEIAEALTA